MDGIAELALKAGTKVPVSSFGSRDPGAGLPGRIVPHMLGMPAFQFCHPVLFRVGVVSDNLSLHGFSGVRK